MIDLTATELQSVAPLLQRMSAEARRTLTIEGLMERWAKFARKVENGYELTGYDYTSELTYRDLLEEILLAVPSVRGKMERELAPLDSRFRAATRELDAPLESAPPEASWWWQRIPLDLSAELASDLLDPDE